MIVVQSERKNGPKTMGKLQVNSGVAKFACWWAPCDNINNLEIANNSEGSYWNK